MYQEPNLTWSTNTLGQIKYATADNFIEFDELHHAFIIDEDASRFSTCKTYNTSEDVLFLLELVPPLSSAAELSIAAIEYKWNIYTSACTWTEKRKDTDNAQGINILRKLVPKNTWTLNFTFQSHFLFYMHGKGENINSIAKAITILKDLRSQKSYQIALLWWEVSTQYYVFCQ